MENNQEIIAPKAVAIALINVHGFEEAIDYVTSAIDNNDGDVASEYWAFVKNQISEIQKEMEMGK